MNTDVTKKDGVYETMYAKGLNVENFDEHIDRFYRSMELIGHPISEDALSKEALKKIVMEKLDAGAALGYKPYAFAKIRITFLLSSGGNLEIDVQKADQRKGPKYDQGVGMVSFQAERENPEAKQQNLKGQNAAMKHAKDHDAEDALLIDKNGYITEGSTSNVFFVIKGVLVTPSIDSGILHGTKRLEVMDLIKKQKLSVEERKIKAGEVLNKLQDVSEMFLTSSIRGVMPVTNIDGKRVGKGRVGEMTKLVMEIAN